MKNGLTPAAFQVLGIVVSVLLLVLLIYRSSGHLLTVRIHVAQIFAESTATNDADELDSRGHSPSPRFGQLND